MDRRKALVVFGIASSVLYTTMLVVVPMRWEGYSSASQTVSELSAIGAPTRPLWTALGTIWTVFYAAFGCGVVWKTGRESRALRVAGVLVVAQGLLGLLWPPMHQREVLAAGGKTLIDTLHIAWTIMNGVLTLAVMALAAAAFGRWFRIYSIATIALLVAAGFATSMDAPRIEANLPTPWVGVGERVNIGAWLLWCVAFSLVLLRLRERPRSSSDGAAEARVPAPPR